MHVWVSRGCRQTRTQCSDTKDSCGDVRVDGGVGVYKRSFDLHEKGRQKKETRSNEPNRRCPSLLNVTSPFLQKGLNEVQVW